MTTRKTIVYGFLAVILVLAFTACSGSGGGGKSLNSAAELKEYLDKQPGNSPDQPIKVAIKANDMMLAEIVGVIKSANKYVSLNLSGSPLTEIPNTAFRDCKTLVGITIGNGVTSIGDYAFSRTGLTSVTIPNNVTSIGNNAFFDCTSLASVTIGNRVTSIGDWAFQGCTNLTSVTIPNSVTSIGHGAFQGCTNLTSITIPNNVASIGNNAFQGCTSLPSITVDSGNTNYANEGGILYNKAKTEIVYVLEGISGNVTISNGVTSIGDSAFTYRTSLTGITIPNSVTRIGDHTFSGCTGLTSITIPNSVTRIGRNAFRDTGLTSITIPNGVTKIDESAFPDAGLVSVTFQGTIASDNFGTERYYFGNSQPARPSGVYSSPFDGDLRNKYLAGGIGTYTRAIGSKTWTKQ